MRFCIRLAEWHSAMLGDKETNAIGRTNLKLTLRYAVPVLGFTPPYNSRGMAGADRAII